MGMFDYLRVQMPLPVEWPGDGSEFPFQTKCTDAQYMERYTIASDGSLVHHTVRRETVPKAERPYPEASDEDIDSLIGSIRSVPTGDKIIPYHGDVVFYDLDDAAGWICLTARFSEGKCGHIWCTEWRPPRDAPDTPPPAGWTPEEN